MSPSTAVELRERLRTGRVLLAGEVGLPYERLPVLYAAAGLDIVWIDLEHTLLGPRDVSALIQVARMAGISPLVRVPELRPGLVRSLLDNGAHGIILPFVEDPEQVKELVSWCRFHPEGRRGVGNPGLAHDFSGVGLAEHVGTDRRPLVAVQIESTAGVAAAAQIVAVDGLDLVVVGLGDLSVSVGEPGRIEADDVRTAAKTVLDECLAAGVAFGLAGLYTGAAFTVPLTRWAQQGARFFQVLADLPALEAAARVAVEAASRELEAWA